MKKILFLYLLMISIALSAQIKLGGGSTATGNAPVNSGYSYSYSQQVYTKQEINADAAGNITGLKFYLTSSANPSYLSNWVVYLGHITQNSLNHQIGWIPVGQMTQVYSGTVTNANGVVEITFTTPFAYDNVRNLVVAVDENGFNSNPTNSFLVYNTMEQALYTESNTVNPDPANPPIGHFLPYKPVVSLMGLAPNLRPDCPVISYPASSLVPTLPTITWTSVQGATSYRVSIGTTPGGTDVINQQSVATTNFTPSSPLSPGTTYYLKVTAVSSAGESSDCVVKQFVTVPPPPSSQIKLGQGSTAIGHAPVNNNFRLYSQQIYTKQEINADAAGNITGLTFYAAPSANAGYAAKWDVYLGNTTKTSFVSNNNWIPSTEMTMVYSGMVSNINGVIDITFTTPFPYDNVRNLVIGVYQKMNNDIPPNQFFVYSTTEGGGMFTNSPAYSGDPADGQSGTFLSYKSVVSLKELVPSLLPVCPSVSYPANNEMFASVSPVITWSMSPGATSYNVSIGTTLGGTDVVNQQSVTTTSFTPSSPLSPSTTYYLKVTAVGPTGESSGCVDVKFKTGPLPPSNDECADAVNLVVNPTIDCTTVTSGTTLLASISGPIPNSCNASSSHNDVWYKFTATSSIHMVRLMNITHVGAVNYGGPYFQVFKGNCGNFSSVACSGSDVLSIMDNLTPGETYYIKVYSTVGQGSAQNFDICVVTFPPTPSNDECVNAIDVPVNPDLTCVNVINGTTTSATNSNVSPTTCYGIPNNDVWFKFTATNLKHIIKLSNIVSKVPTNNNSSELYFQVYKGNCSNLTSLSCSYQNVLIVNNLTVGDTYYVRVYSRFGGISTAINFDICIGAVIPPPPPSNDEPANAIVLPVNPNLNCTVVTAGSTLGATASNISVPICGGGTNPGDVWFKFTATAIGHLITLKDMVSLGVLPGIVSAFQVLKVDTNGNLTSIQCIRGSVGSASGLTVGATYYIRVSNLGADQATGFNICIGTLPPSPVNDDCSGALVVSSYPYSYTQTDAIAATNNNGFISVCTPAINDGTWFTFTGDGSTHKILVKTSDSFEYYNDLKVGIYKGSCGNLTCVTAIYPTYLLFLPTVAGTVYYINVGNQSGTQDNIEGTFTITIQREGNGSLATSEVSKAKEDIEAYPNPFTDVLNISKADKVKSVSVLDVTGRLVKTIENPSTVLQLRDLKEGMYLVVLNMKDGTKQTVKAIKK